MADKLGLTIYFVAITGLLYWIVFCMPVPALK